MKYVTIPDELYKKLDKDSLSLIEEGAYLIEAIADECSTESGYKAKDFIELYHQRLQFLINVEETKISKHLEDMQLNINHFKNLNERCEDIKETMEMIGLRYYAFLI